MKSNSELIGNRRNLNKQEVLELMDLARAEERKGNYQRLVQEEGTYADGFAKGCFETKEKIRELLNNLRRVIHGAHPYKLTRKNILDEITVLEKELSCAKAEGVVSCPENELMCPHARASWKSCPHCLGINKDEGEKE